jgi:NADPH:quinone reductase
MKARPAAAVQVRAFGGPEQLELVESSPARPGPGEVLLRVASCGLNHGDLLMRQGLYLGGPRPPFRPGMEAAGTVEEVGDPLPGAPALQKGQRVATLAGRGLQASRVVVEASSCVALPDGLELLPAGALPICHLTAYHALVTVGRAQPGETVLVHGASGGLGSAAVRIARRLGLRVLATAGTPEKAERALALGAEAAAGYQDFEGMVRRLTAGRGPDLVLETVGGEVMRRSLRLLPPFGRLVLLGMVGRDQAALDPVQLLFRSQAILGFHLRSLLDRPELIAPSLRLLFGWLAAGELAVDLGAVLPLAEIRQAHELLAARRVCGKIVLVPDPR